MINLHISKLASRLACGLIGSMLALGTGSVFAQAKTGTANWVDSAKSAYWKNSSGECWRASYWTPAMAVAECDPSLVKKEEPKKPEVKKQDTVPARPLIPTLGPDKPALRVTIQAETLFNFDKAVLRADGKKTLDDEVAAKMKAHPEVEVLLVSGHADRIGKDKYNQSLSEKRANAVKDYLVSQGVADKRIEASGKGEAEPVVDCNNVKGAEHRNNKKLVECLQPNRRVVVEVKVQGPLIK